MPLGNRYTWKVDPKTKEYVVWDGWFLCEVKRYRRHSAAKKYCALKNKR